MRRWGWSLSAILLTFIVSEWEMYQECDLLFQYYRFMKALSYASLDKEDLLSPINQNTLQRSSSVRSMVSNATYGSSDDYIGLALPVDINEIFQVCMWYPSGFIWIFILMGSQLFCFHWKRLDGEKRGKMDRVYLRSEFWRTRVSLHTGSQNMTLFTENR